MSWTTTKTATDRWFLLSDTYVSIQGILDATVSDTGHSGKTHIIREGVCLTYSGQKWYYTDGTTHTATNGVLLRAVDMKDGDTANSHADHPGAIVVIGAVSSGQCINVSGTTVNAKLFLGP
jgi:hypothetical protein